MFLNKDYFQNDAIFLAKDLLGKILVREINGKKILCKIVETEAYIGPEDKACHAYNNKRTKRTEAMFLEGGCTYVYMIYGMYNCLNIVANKKDKPEAVLIRAVEPLNELEYLKKNRNIKSKKRYDLTNGPGKLCKALKIDKKLNKYDLCKNKKLFILDSKDKKIEIVEAKRINIEYAEEYKYKLWRFYIKGNKFVSKI
ncbi:DNA-3-methyladenine glycosylase [Hypnocyclicus thermotrophus]|uniref:Putative 3-methyladenine DNA glycosylase n=1 Tax=Hypnocyclicus thermotrophus TaxID=1627895 RepID=A0AA46E1C2_9FUSO|nr:DNA-3-methyladenine glycosylase [Hypnocyclicus thermotrophus]TDT72483.1 DNA-3-methyladenine glycosylase [Hypnocyclicus thermotrophus]